MGHIVNPNIYRLGKMVPWVSSGFKRVTNERSKVANEDFLIYNFTRNFFYKKVYKKVIGKIKKAKLKVRRRKHVRKTKRKRKFGQTALLNHWIIKYSHLTITRFNKTFQLNLFFFDRELQSKYRARHRRSLQKFKAKRIRKKVVAEKKIKKLKILLQRKLKNKKTKKVLKTKVYFSGIANTLYKKGKQQIRPTVENLSLNMANDIRNFIKPKRIEKNNYTVARARKTKGIKREKIYIYKDNTFAKNKINNRNEVSQIDNTNEYYKNLYSAKILKKLYYRPWLKKYTPDFFKPQENFYIDANYFRTHAKSSNKYLYFKGVVANNPKILGLSGQMAYNKKRSYIESMRKSTNSFNNAINTSSTVMREGIKRFERKTESLKMKLAARQLKSKSLIKYLKQTEIWKKHYLRMKLALKAKKLTKRKKRRIKVKYRSAKNFARRIMKKNKRI